MSERKLKNTNHRNIPNKGFIKNQLHQKILKFRTNIDKNSHVFFCTYRRIQEKDIVESQLDKANERVNSQKSRKKKLLSSILLIANILLVALVFYNFATEQGGIQPLSTLFTTHPRWTFLFIALGLYLLTVMFNSLKFAVLLKNRTGKFRMWFSFKIASIGRYYDCVTPLGTGGQPFEIYYLKKNGISGDTATAIPLAKYMGWQFSTVILCLFILICYSKNYINTPLVLALAWTGLSITLLVFLFVFFMSITKKFGASLVVGILKLLHKMRIVKNYKTTLIKVLKFVKGYQYCMKSFAKNPITVISEIFVSIGSTIANASIAFFVLQAFSTNPNTSWWSMVCSCCICEIATTFVPMPGGSGAQELSFNALLGNLFPDGTLFWGVLFWRILTYYMYIIQGGIILICDVAISKKRLKKAFDNNTIKLSNNNENTNEIDSQAHNDTNEIIT